MAPGPKDLLKDYLQDARDVLLWKLDGLSERELRLPRTPTGLTLLGIIKHALNTEVVYFSTPFGRAFPWPEELARADADPMADWYATEDETVADLIDLYRRVQVFVDRTIDELPLDATGTVAHWGDAEVTLHWVLVHTIVDLQRHAGHADIIREQIDGAIGLRQDLSNLPDGVDWTRHTARLTEIADRFPDEERPAPATNGPARG